MHANGVYADQDSADSPFTDKAQSMDSSLAEDTRTPRRDGFSLEATPRAVPALLRRFNTQKQKALQQDVNSFSNLVMESQSELSSIIKQWQTMVDLLGARLDAWKNGTDVRLSALLQRVREIESEVDSYAADLDADAAAMEAMQAALADERRVFVQEMRNAKAEFEANKALACSVSTAAVGRVKLNVGGQHFELSMDTLCREKGSFFERLLGGNFNLVKDPEGYTFIDRDGAPYPYIFNWLRDGQKAVLPLDDPTMIKRLLAECDFLGLEGLRTYLQQQARINGKGEQLTGAAAHVSVVAKSGSIKAGKKEKASSPSRFRLRI